MKKHISYLALSVLVLGFFACDLQLPTGAKFVGTPNFSVNYEFELSNLLADFFADSLGEESGFKIIRCTQPDTMTFMVHFNALDDTSFKVPDTAVGQMEEIVGNLVEGTINQAAVEELFPSGEEIDQTVLSDKIDEIMADLGENDDLVVNFDWGEASVGIDQAAIKAALTSDATKQKIIASIMEEGPSAANIEEIIAQVVQETILEVIAETEVTISHDIDLMEDFSEPIPLALGDFGAFLDGFTINGLQARIYLSVVDENGETPDFLNSVDVGLKVTDSDDVELLNESIENYTLSGVDLNSSTWIGSALPNPTGGLDVKNIVDLLLTSDDEVFINLSAIIDSSNNIKLDFIGKTFYIKAEMVIWLPLSLGFTTEASFDIPLGDSESDFFGRNEPGAPELLDFINSMTLKIRLSASVFNGLAVELVNKKEGSDFSIEFPFTGSEITLSITGNDLDKLNTTANYPFIPEVRIKLGNNGSLIMPQALSLVSVAIEADLEYYMAF
ncbi:MAG: hypothetical protein FWC01_06845 [Treponema sp.]|nr:hypothetical protein [Treponema sp.]MCL2237698.1 hypothetical protein [Treponema sp.]